MLFFLFVVSCSKDDTPAPEPTPPPSSGPVAPKLTGRELFDVKILQGANPELSEDAHFYRPATGSTYYMTIPRGFTDRNLEIEIVSSEKSTITVNGTALTMMEGTLNSSKVAMGKTRIQIDEIDRLGIQVSAEDGFRSSYEVLVQDGIVAIDAMVYPFLIKYNIPAGSFAIGKNSEEDIVYKTALGYADVNKKERAGPHHLFRLASMSKQFTAIGIMALIQEGKIGIDDAVFGPDGILKDQWSSVSARSAQVTIQHLLEHTLGYDAHDIMFSAASPNTLERRVDMLLQSSGQHVPGTVFLYSNMGYGLLGRVIEVVSGKDYITFLQELFAPIGAEDVYLAARNAQSVREHEATLYAQTGSSGAYGSDIDVYKAAGGILTNTDNLFKMLYAVDGGSKKPDILNDEMRELMFTPSTVFRGYAKGWRTNHSLFDGYYHGGNLIGTATFWIYGTEYSAAMLLNSRSYEPNFGTDLIELTKDIMEKAKELGL